MARYSDARANYALTLYQVIVIHIIPLLFIYLAADIMATCMTFFVQLDRQEDAVKAMNDVIRKNPGYADMHVAIAADAW